MEYILVTGAAGFIGSHLCERLISEGYGVVGVDNFDPYYARSLKEKNLSNLTYHPHFTLYENDIRNGCLMEIASKYNFSCVVHLAGKVGVRPSIEHTQDYIDHNISATLSVLEMVRRFQIKKYIFASSSSVYGNNKNFPWKETLDVNEPISPYAFSKKSCEMLNYSYHHLYQIDVVNLRFFTVYGPRQRPDLAISKFFNLIKDNLPIPIYGDGSTQRDYTFVSDTIDGIFNTIHFIKGKKGVYEVINLGSGNPIKLNDLITELKLRFGNKVRIQELPEQPGDVKITAADNTKAKKLINFEPKVDFRSGLKLFETSY